MLCVLCIGSIIYQYFLYTGLEPDISPDEQEEKARLIAQVLELQNTLDGQYSSLPLDSSIAPNHPSNWNIILAIDKLKMVLRKL